MNMNDWPSLGIPLEHLPETVQVIDLDVRGKNDPYAEMLALPCPHFGSPDQSITQLKMYLDVVKHNKHIAIAALGGLIDLRKHKGEKYLAEALDVKAMLDSAAQHYKPVGDRFVVGLYGEDDLQLNKSMIAGYDWVKHFFTRIRPKKAKRNFVVPHEPGRGILVVVRVAKKQAYPVYLFHSNSGAFLNEFLTIKRANHNFAAPLIICGHPHRIDERRQEVVGVVKLDNKWYEVGGSIRMLLAGGFQKQTVEDERKQAPINPVGARIVRFMRDFPGIEIIDPRGHYQDYFTPGQCKYTPDKNFRFREDEWPFLVRKRGVNK